MYTGPQNIQKPLLWDRVKSQLRFRRFADKVVHIVLDDVDVLAAEQGNIWGLELLQVRRCATSAKERISSTWLLTTLFNHV